MTNKVTKRDNFNALLNIPEVASNAELVAFINHELELLDRKNKAKSGELTETQKENLALGEEFVAFIASKDHALTVAEIRKHFGLSSQKATPILANLVEAGKLVKTVEKRVSFYSVA